MTPFRVSVQRPPEDLYGPVIRELMELEFPGSAPIGVTARVGSTAFDTIFEAVSREIVGTKQHRNGPTPPPETLVLIREVVRDAMARRVPIPILVPWGGYKQGPFGVDIAELMALKQLRCLAGRVSAHYELGVWIVTRLEDLSADDPSVVKKTKEYCQKFKVLHNIVAENNDMSLVLESDLMRPTEFDGATTNNAMIIREAFRQPEARRWSFIKQNIPTWSGELPDEQLDYYRGIYSRFYADEDDDAKDWRLARYFGAAAARFQLRGTGMPTDIVNYITLAFNCAPWGKMGRRIHYRTMPERYTHQHKAPWIGKGYIKILNRTATPAIAGFDGDGLMYDRNTMVVHDSTESVEIDADYVTLA